MLLLKAYLEMQKLFAENAKFDSPVPSVPSIKDIANFLFLPENVWKLKRYPSLYMSVSDRNNFWEKCVQKVQNRCDMRVETTLLSIEKSKDGYFALVLRKQEILETVFCRKVVLAGGRFMPLQKILQNVGTNESTKFLRHEFGFRIQVPTKNNAVLKIAELGCKDPKLVMSPDAEIEYRTFCFCLDGQVLKSTINGLTTFSGRADVEPTGFTNFAILVRTKSANVFPAEEIESFVQKPFEFSHSATLRQDIVSHFAKESPKIAKLIWAAIESLFEKFPDFNCEQLTFFGPCLEGVGEYPNVDLHMKVKHAPGIYAIGDTHGQFRGLVPSFLSGFYLAQCFCCEEKKILFLSNNLQKHAEIAAVFGPLLFLKIDSIDNSSSVSVQYQFDVQSKISFLISKFRQSNFFAPKQLLLMETTMFLVKKTMFLMETTNFTINDNNVAILRENLAVDELLKFAAENSKVTMSTKMHLICGDTGTILHETRGMCDGTIVQPRGSNGFYWDSMFQPIESTKTFGEMEQAEKNWRSARGIATNEMAKKFFQ